MATAGSLGSPRVSVVLPVYNTAPYLRECLDSLVGQDLPATELEVVAIDDGSDDGSEEILDEYARGYASLRVVHQPNSGWPGQPRNRGLELSRGGYVFFLDSDDRLGPEALRRLCDFADEHGSDIVVPRMVYSRQPPARRWETLVEVPPAFVLRTLSPQKLFRRSFLDEHELRFPEGKIRLEDGIFTSRAYLLAERISLLTDYDHYYKRRREEGKNISLTAVDPEGYVRSLLAISDTLRELSPDPELADELVLDIYVRKGLRWLRPARFLTYKPRRRRRWVEAMAKLTDAHIRRELQQRLPTKQRLLSEFVRRRDVSAVTAISASQGSGMALKAVKMPLGLRLELNGRAERARELRGLVEADDQDLVVEQWHARLRRRALAQTRRRAGRLVRKLRPAVR